MPERIGIIGNGKLAAALARGLQQCNAGPLFVAARNWNVKTEELFAGFTRCSLDTTLPESDILFFCVSDGAVAQLASAHSALTLNIHCAGSMPLSLLPETAAGRAILWPVHSFTGTDTNWQQIPVAVDASSEKYLRIVMDVCTRIGTGQVLPLGFEERSKLHLAAVFVSNFTNAMYAAAEDILGHDTAQQQMLLHLLHDTALRYEGHNARRLQSGPAIRGDHDTLQKQEQQLRDKPLLNILYVAASNYIRSFTHEDK